jgi:hypothetical protein
MRVQKRATKRDEDIKKGAISALANNLPQSLFTV